MLRQRVDRHERLECLGEIPVLGELLGVKSRPVADEPQRAWRQRPAEHTPSPEFDLSDVLTVLRVEVRRRVVGAVHPDHDAVEGGQSRHAVIVRIGPAEIARASSGVRHVAGIIAPARFRSGCDRVDQSVFELLMGHADDEADPQLVLRRLAGDGVQRAVRAGPATRGPPRLRQRRAGAATRAARLRAGRAATQAQRAGEAAAASRAGGGR
jgi:hypothetical protein